LGPGSVSEVAAGARAQTIEETPVIQNEIKKRGKEKRMDK
jgi:hypothetical protein